MHFIKLIKDEEGATAIEYGLMLAMISMACVIAFQMLGLDLGTVFSTIARAMGAK
jgi:pilus assembly protein Flp/PilA